MISPQGYQLGNEPYAKNPFWDTTPENQNVGNIMMDAEVDNNVGKPSAHIDKTVSGRNIHFHLDLRNLKGEKGEDGYTPSVTVNDITGGHRVVITDKGSAHTFDIMDGVKGEKGNNGVNPNVSVVNIEGGHRVTITDANGSESFDVMDGAKGDNGTAGAKGDKGEDGKTPVITVTATQNGNEIPVTKTGSDEAPTFAFAFTGESGSGSGSGSGKIIQWEDQKKFPVKNVDETQLDNDVPVSFTIDDQEINYTINDGAFITDHITGSFVGTLPKGSLIESEISIMLGIQFPPEIARENGNAKITVDAEKTTLLLSSGRHASVDKAFANDLKREYNVSGFGNVTLFIKVENSDSIVAVGKNKVFTNLQGSNVQKRFYLVIKERE